MGIARSSKVRLIPVALTTLVLGGLVIDSGQGQTEKDGDKRGELQDYVALRMALDGYLATAVWPDPQPIDPQLFAEDIEAFWSNGDTHRGRDAVVEAMKVGVKEIGENFVTFGVTAEDVKTHGADDAVWITCILTSKGTLTKERGEFDRKTRSTFVFEKRDDRWQMVHEHSSRIRPIQK